MLIVGILMYLLMVVAFVFIFIFLLGLIHYALDKKRKTIIFIILFVFIILSYIAESASRLILFKQIISIF